MKREHFKGYSFAKYARDIEDDLALVSPVEDTKPVMSDKAEDSLLRLIYSRDARTGLPVGDLTYYVSDKANPEVKAFILQNLMQDVSAAANPTIPKDIPEELAMDLMRNSDESYDQYVSRLMQYKIQNETIVKNAQSVVVPSDPAAVSE